MKKTRKQMVSRMLVTCTAAVLMAATVYAAQEPIVYPAKGQSADKMEKDKYSCYSWAKKQTGFDPMQAPAPSAAATSQPQGGALKGAAKGAAGGAIIGAVAGDAGKGAAIGAATGGTVGAVRKRKNQKDQEAAAQNEAAGADQKRSEYNRAWGACLEGKGYTVK